MGFKDGRPLPAQDEPLHAYITSSNPDNVKKAVDKVSSSFTIISTGHIWSNNNNNNNNNTTICKAP